jgi:hypothetical protein
MPPDRPFLLQRKKGKKKPLMEWLKGKVVSSRQCTEAAVGKQVWRRRTAAKALRFIDLFARGAVDYGQTRQGREIDSGYAGHRFCYSPTLPNEADKNKSGRLLHRNGATHA